MLDILNIPEECRIDNTIFKKMFIENSDLNSADKKILSNVIDKIVWRYSIKEATCYIRPYEDDVRGYDEVEIIEISLKERQKEGRIAEMVMRAIPYPMLLLLMEGNEFKLFVAHQRKNQSDVSKNVLGDIISTAWTSDTNALAEIAYEKLDKSNIYSFYSNIVDNISIYTAKASGAVENYEEITGEEARQITERREEILQEISALRSKLKQETQFNKKMELNIKIKRLEGEIDGN